MTTDLELTLDDFDTKVLGSDKPVLLDFWAEWCGPCKMIAPHIEAIAKEYAGKADVYKVDVDKERELAERYGVMSIPTLMVFKDGKLFEQMVGAHPKQAIEAVLNRAIG